MIGLSQRTLPDNTQHSHESNIHAPDGIRTHNPSKRAIAYPRLKPRRHWDRNSSHYNGLLTQIRWFSVKPKAGKPNVSQAFSFIRNIKSFYIIIIHYYSFWIIYDGIRLGRVNLETGPILLLTLIFKAKFNNYLKGHYYKPLICDIKSMAGYKHSRGSDVRLLIFQIYLQASL